MYRFPSEQLLDWQNIVSIAEAADSTRAFLPLTLDGAIAEDMDAFEQRLGDDWHPADNAGRAVVSEAGPAAGEAHELRSYYFHTVVGRRICATYVRD